MPARIAPVRFRELLDALKRKVFTANLDWQLYSQLYRKSPERIADLNRAAHVLFSRVQWHLLDGVLLALSRLTDPAIGRRPKKGEEPEEFNLSIKLLVREIEEVEKEYARQSEEAARANPPPGGQPSTEPPEEFSRHLRADLNAMKSDIDYLHGLRNKHLAHNDYDYTGAARNAPSLDELSYAFLEGLFVRLHALLNRAELYYCDAETLYDHPITVGVGDGDWLALLLERVFKDGDPRLKPPES